MVNFSLSPRDCLACRSLPYLSLSPRGALHAESLLLAESHSWTWSVILTSSWSLLQCPLPPLLSLPLQLLEWNTSQPSPSISEEHPPTSLSTSRRVCERPSRPPQANNFVVRHRLRSCQKAWDPLCRIAQVEENRLRNTVRKR